MPEHYATVSRVWFTIILAVMLALNVSRLAFPWRAYQTDGHEQLGFPFAFFERGGFSFEYAWHFQYLFADFAIAISVAFAGALLPQMRRRLEN